MRIVVVAKRNALGVVVRQHVPPVRPSLAAVTDTTPVVGGRVVRPPALSTDVHRPSTSFASPGGVTPVVRANPSICGRPGVVRPLLVGASVPGVPSASAFSVDSSVKKTLHRQAISAMPSPNTLFRPEASSPPVASVENSAAAISSNSISPLEAGSVGRTEWQVFNGQRPALGNGESVPETLKLFGRVRSAAPIVGQRPRVSAGGPSVDAAPSCRSLQNGEGLSDRAGSPSKLLRALCGHAAPPLVRPVAAPISRVVKLTSGRALRSRSVLARLPSRPASRSSLHPPQAVSDEMLLGVRRAFAEPPTASEEVVIVAGPTELADGEVLVRPETANSASSYRGLIPEQFLPPVPARSGNGSVSTCLGEARGHFADLEGARDVDSGTPTPASSSNVASVSARPGDVDSGTPTPASSSNVASISARPGIRRPGVRDRAGRMAMKDNADPCAATESRSKKHLEIRPTRARRGSAISARVYQRLLDSRLELTNVSTREKLLREQITRLRSQSVTVQTVFNPVAGIEELRLIDAQKRIVVRHEEIDAYLTYLWEDGYKLDTNHTLRRKVAAQFCGIGSKKVEMFLSQMVNPTVRKFPVPHVQQPRHVLASRPLEHIQIDCTHLHSVIHQGSVVTGLITFLDIFSKFVFAWPIVAECTWEVCRAFSLFCCLYGTPEIVQTDNGHAFLGEMTTMAEQLYGCKVIHGRVRYPQAQGGVERVHGKLKDNIIGLSYEHFRDIQRWPEMVPMAMRISNLAQHSVFNEELTPFSVFFGRVENYPLAADAELLNGTYIQKTSRLQNLERKQMARLAGRVNIEPFLASNQMYDVELCFRPDEERGVSGTDSAYIAAGESVQEVLDDALAYADEDAQAIDRRVGYTAAGMKYLFESGAVVRRVLEFHRQCAEALLRRRPPNGQTNFELSDILRDVFVGDSSVRDAIQTYATFATNIRAAAAKFTVAYVESVDAGTRKRMPAPYQQNEAVWVLTLSEDPVLSKRYQAMWMTATDRRLRERLPGVIRSVDARNVNRPYEIEIFMDGQHAADEGRSQCELAWLSGAALAPKTTFQRKLRQYGVLTQVPGLCVQRVSPTLFCLRRATPKCLQSLCELHCSESATGTCGAHRASRRALFVASK